MATNKRNRRKTTKKETRIFDLTNTQVISLCLIGAGLLYLLALVSYTPDDVPFGPFSKTSHPNSPPENFLGKLGAFGAGLSYWVIGAAGYLVPACLIWFGVSKLLFGARTTWRALSGFALLVLSSCCLLEYQGLFFRSWSDAYNIPGAGGLIGSGIGGGLFANLAGTVGAFLLMFVVYLVAVTMVTGFHPAHFGALCYEGFQSWRDERELRLIAEADENDRLVLQKRRLERERKKLHKRLGRAGLLEDEAEAALTAKPGSRVRRKADADPTDELPLAEPEAAPAAAAPVEEPSPTESLVTPEDAADDGDDGGMVLHSDPEAEEVAGPKIYDANERLSEEEAAKKPSIAEVLAANRAKADAEKGVAGDGFSGARAVEFPGYALPAIGLLKNEEVGNRKPADKSLLIQTQNTIIETLDHFNVKVSAGDITRGPTITRYEIYPSKGLRVSRITQLEADIARATKAERINILAPIPGKDTVGIEIANNEKVIVPLRELFEDSEFTDPKHKIPLALGKDVYGKTVVGDLAKMPHLLVAGATGAGKSVCINGIIASMLYRFTPDELRFIMIDPKVVEMQVYNSLPHQIVPVVTDPKKVLLALRWVVNEMERRYQLFAKFNVRNFESFNERRRSEAVDAEELEPGDELFDADGQATLDFTGERAQAAAASADGDEEEGEWEYEYEEEDGTDGGEASADDAGGEGEDGEWEYEYVEWDEDGESEAAEGDAEDGEWEYEYEEVEVEYEAEEDAGDEGAGDAGAAAGDDLADGEAFLDEEDDDEGSPAAHSADLLPSAHERVTRAQRLRDGEIAAQFDEAEAQRKREEEASIPDRLPYIVVIIDELADLMQTAPADVEAAIARIAQKARAAGIHLIIATQTPRADVVTGIIKANIPSRIAFQVSSALDSRVILDNKGAEKLVGKGDMLYLPPGSAQLQRAQGALITDDECVSVVNFCAGQAEPVFEEEMADALDGGADGDEEISDEDEECVEKCLEVIQQERRASTSLLQRRLRLGYTRAARMMDILEMRGIIGPGEGAKPREILVDLAD